MPPRLCPTPTHLPLRARDEELDEAKAGQRNEGVNIFQLRSSVGDDGALGDLPVPVERSIAQLIMANEDWLGFSCGWPALGLSSLHL